MGGDSETAQRSSYRTSKVGSSILIGPSYSNVPIRYHSKVSYQSYVGDVLQRLRGGGAGGVVFPDWMPCSSDWAEIPQRFALLQGPVLRGRDHRGPFLRGRDCRGLFLRGRDRRVHF